MWYFERMVSHISEGKWAKYKKQLDKENYPVLWGDKGCFVRLSHEWTLPPCFDWRIEESASSAFSASFSLSLSRSLASESDPIEWRATSFLSSCGRHRRRRWPIWNFFHSFPLLTTTPHPAKTFPPQPFSAQNSCLFVCGCSSVSPSRDRLG